VKNYHQKKNPKIAFNNLPTIERRRGVQELQQGEVSKRKFSIHTYIKTAIPLAAWPLSPCPFPLPLTSTTTTTSTAATTTTTTTSVHKKRTKKTKGGQ
jgi:hypothetical protein